MQYRIVIIHAEFGGGGISTFSPSSSSSMPRLRHFCSRLSRNLGGEPWNCSGVGVGFAATDAVSPDDCDSDSKERVRYEMTRCFSESD